MDRLTKQWGKDNINCVATELDYLCLVGLEEHEFLAFDKIVRTLAYYEDLEESGLLHVAPVKDGTKIFYIDDRDFMDFEKMVFDDTYLNGFTEYCHGEFNKDWFLTRDEAELKLKEMK